MGSFGYRHGSGPDVPVSREEFLRVTIVVYLSESFGYTLVEKFGDPLLLPRLLS
jgi:hypothetical protein